MYIYIFMYENVELLSWMICCAYAHTHIYIHTFTYTGSRCRLANPRLQRSSSPLPGASDATYPDVALQMIKGV